MSKPNCYDCRWRGPLLGDTHSCCNHPSLDGAVRWLATMLFLDNQDYEPLNVTGSPHGIRNGWFCWPINFDPIWLESCDGFEKREEVKSDEQQTQSA